MHSNDHQQVAIVIQVKSGTFEKGFRIQGDVFNNGTPIARLRNCRQLPAAQEVPRLYQAWRQAYGQLGQDPTARMGMSSLQTVEGQTTNYSASSRCQQATQALESALKNWFAQSEFNLLDALIRAESIVHADQSVPVIFDFDTGDEATDTLLRKLPWHLWPLFRRTLLNAEVVLSTGRYRQVEPLQHPVKVLVVLGSSEGDINVDDDRQTWESIRHQGAQLTVLEQPKPEELDQQLRSHSWDILFFAGHSSSQQDRLDDGYLQINDHEVIQLEYLDEALLRAAQKGLKLAIFNSCDGLGLAHFLARLEVPVPFSVVMREPVPDVIARKFLKEFLAEFSQDKPLYLAMREARSHLRCRQSNYPGATWLPILCQNPTQPELFWPPEPQVCVPSDDESQLADESAGTTTPLPQRNAPAQHKRYWPWVVGGLGLAVLGAIVALWQPWRSQQPVVENIKSVAGDEYSFGEEFLLRASRSPVAQAGVESFRRGDHEEAQRYFLDALRNEVNDPELLIYLNNAQAAISGKPITTIAVSIPGTDARADAKELLRGVAQAQAENNCGVEPIVRAVQDTAPLECQGNAMPLQVLIADHENRNDAPKVLQRFTQVSEDSRVIGLIGRYNSSMTFTVEDKIISDGIKMPVISTTSTAVRKSDQAVSGYVFRTSPTDAAATQKWHAHLQLKGAQRLIVLSNPDSPYSQSLRNELFKLLSVTAREQLYDCDLANIDSCLKDIQGRSIDAIVLAPPDERDDIATALNFVDRYEVQYGNNPVVLGGDTLYGNQQVLSRITEDRLLEQLLVAVPWHRSRNPTAFENDAWALWRSKINWRTAMAYDATQLFLSATSQLGDCKDLQTCRQDVRDIIRANGLDDGATGKMRFSDDGNRIVGSDDGVSVLVKVNLADRTFECVAGEPCAN